MRPSSASTPLSSSALNYLESLERNAKALRGNNISSNNKKDESSIIPTSKQTSSATSHKRRESISDIINHVRRKSLSRTNSDDFDFLNESLKSSVFDESDSSETESEESHEERRILPLGTPGQQVGRKSLKDIRELRNSIDQSLIKTPELKMLKTKAAGEETRKLKHFESIQEESSPEDTPKIQFPAKSPFKKAIQSGSDSSDGESIVFDEVFEEVIPPRKPAPIKAEAAPAVGNVNQNPVRSNRKKDKTPIPTSSSSESSSSSTSSASSSSESFSSSESSSLSELSESGSSKKSSSSKSTSKPAYDSDFETSSSSASSYTVPKPSSKKKPPKPEKSKNPKVELKKVSPVPYEDFIPKRSSSSESAKSTVRETHRTLNESLEINRKDDEKKKEKETIRVVREKNEQRNSSKVAPPKEKMRSHRSSSSSSSSAVGETEREIDYEQRREKVFRSRRRRSEEPHTCQQNIHNMVESVIDTHVQMLDDFNRMEYAAVCQWTDVLRKFERHDGPTSKRLREIVQQRLNRKY